MDMERTKYVFEQLPNSGIFYPKIYFTKNMLFSSQIGNANLDSMLNVFDIRDRHSTIMEDNDGLIIVFDGHHSVGYSIYENTPCPYTKIEYYDAIRRNPFSVFYANFKRLLPREY